MFDWMAENWLYLILSGLALIALMFVIRKEEGMS